MNEDQIIMGIKKYDDEVIGFLYQDCFESVTTFLQSKGCEFHQSHDIFQESILALVKNIQKGAFKGESKVKTYLSTIAKYTLYSSQKKQGKLVLMEEFPEHLKSGSEISKIEEDEVDRTIQKELLNLSGECKKLLLENVFRDTPLKKVAEHLNLTYNFVRQKKRRCLNQLKSLLLKNQNIKELYG